ncbi:nitroreductase family protein [Spirochaetia bacterium 38H-sp]|uniref:Nitroreductase family protein n=1 Tax=Rarispira pelagica TaxID=3141764 RepID=A0ABU9UC89_9SPIR
MKKSPALDYIFSRRSIRKYKPDPVEDSSLELILKAAMSAPSAVAKDPWRFVIIDDFELKKKTADALPHGKFLVDAPVGILVCGDLSAAHGGLEGYLIQDCSAAIENLLLAVNSLGLGACWLGVYPREERIDAMRNIFELPKNILPVACISLGYPAEEKKSRDRYNPSYVHRNHWK